MIITRIVWASVVIAAARDVIQNRVIVGPECWQWQASGDGRYGHAHFLGSRFKAHRLSYLAFVGRIPRGRVIDHLCNNPACCNPEHLAAVTQSQNIKRCFTTGRGRSPFMKETK